MLSIIAQHPSPPGNKVGNSPTIRLLIRLLSITYIDITVDAASTNSEIHKATPVALCITRNSWLCKAKLNSIYQERPVPHRHQHASWHRRLSAPKQLGYDEAPNHKKEL